MFDNSVNKRNDFIYVLTLYLAMECWFHENNSKGEVKASRRYIGNVLKRMKEVFPREEGQGWNIPKHHGMTKMQYYMVQFGSAMNFYGGPGESHHRHFVKFPGDNTHRGVLVNLQNKLQTGSMKLCFWKSSRQQWRTSKNLSL